MMLSVVRVGLIKCIVLAVDDVDASPRRHCLRCTALSCAVHAQSAGAAHGGRETRRRFTPRSTNDDVSISRCDSILFHSVQGANSDETIMFCSSG